MKKKTFKKLLNASIVVMVLLIVYMSYDIVQSTIELNKEIDEIGQMIRDLDQETIEINEMLEEELRQIEIEYQGSEETE